MCFWKGFLTCFSICACFSICSCFFSSCVCFFSLVFSTWFTIFWFSCSLISSCLFFCYSTVVKSFILCIAHFFSFVVLLAIFIVPVFTFTLSCFTVLFLQFLNVTVTNSIVNFVISLLTFSFSCCNFSF